MDKFRSRLRKQVSKAVHEAVCEYTGTNGKGHCLFYAIAGASVATNVFGKLYFPQAGILQVMCDPDAELCWGIDPSQHPDGFLAGEFPCWFASCHEPVFGKSTKASEIVDLSSRHYRAFHADAIWCEQGKPPEWKCPDPPEFLWTDGIFPDWVRMIPDEMTTNQLMEYFAEAKAEWSEVVKLAQRRIEQFGQKRPPRNRDKRADRKRKKLERQRRKSARRK